MGAFCGSADCKGVRGWWAACWLDLDGCSWEGKIFNTESTKGAEDTETESRSDDLTKYWGEEPGEDLLATCAHKGVPACFSSLAETGSVYRKTE
jgi:hypothetical protein